MRAKNQEEPRVFKEARGGKAGLFSQSSVGLRRDRQVGRWNRPHAQMMIEVGRTPHMQGGGTFSRSCWDSVLSVGK